MINSSRDATLFNLEMQSHWACYICIRAAGFLENSIKELFSSYIRGKANENVANFAIRQLDSINNPKTKKFIEVANCFSKEWAADIQNFSDSNGYGYAIDAIMTNRHQIAHGKDSSITVTRLQDYLDRSVKLLEYIETVCK